MIGFLRYVTSFIFYMSWSAGKVLLAALIGVKQRPGGVYDWGARHWAQGMLRGTGITVRVEGRERLLTPEPKVYISNHASFVDIWAMLAEFPGTIRFIYKKGMDWIPLMGQAMRAARHIPINRQSRSASFASYDEAAKFIRDEGISAIVFAEGTRSRNGLLKPFKKGPFVLAIAAGAPVVPVFCENTYELMPRGSWSPKPGIVTLKIGEPIPTAGLTVAARDALATQTRDAIVALGARE
jgi:1-acyl-sn-glycerol-3-phosphate acyltransferase